MPTSPSTKKAREYFLLREQWLPDLQFTNPKLKYTGVSAVVEGVRIADTVANPQSNQTVADATYTAAVRKGHKAARRGVPFEKGDFDALWVFHPDKVHMWLIPAHVLVEKGVMATPQQPGKTGFCLYDLSYTKPARPRRKADLWTQEYLLSFQDPGFMGKVLKVLEAAKP